MASGFLKRWDRASQDEQRNPHPKGAGSGFPERATDRPRLRGGVQRHNGKREDTPATVKTGGWLSDSHTLQQKEPDPGNRSPEATSGWQPSPRHWWKSLQLIGERNPRRWTVKCMLRRVFEYTHKALSRYTSSREIRSPTYPSSYKATFPEKS